MPLCAECGSGRRGNCNADCCPQCCPRSNCPQHRGASKRQWPSDLARRDNALRRMQAATAAREAAAAAAAEGSNTGKRPIHHSYCTRPSTRRHRRRHHQLPSRRSRRFLNMSLPAALLSPRSQHSRATRPRRGTSCRLSRRSPGRSQPDSRRRRSYHSHCHQLCRRLLLRSLLYCLRRCH